MSVRNYVDSVLSDVEANTGAAIGALLVAAGAGFVVFKFLIPILSGTTLPENEEEEKETENGGSAATQPSVCSNKDLVIGGRYKVACVQHWCNVRSSPEIKANNIVASAPKGTIYTILDKKKTDTYWWGKVGQSGNLENWIRSDKLEPA